MRFSRFSAAALLMLAACSDSTGSGKAGPAARLDIVAGDLQTQAVAGAELPQPLVVKVVDAKGKPVQSQLVNWVVTAGGGHVFAGSSLTNASGEARERWTLGTVAGDTQRVEVRAVDSSTGQALVFATFRAVGQPGPATALVAVDGAGQGGDPGVALRQQLVVRVTDANGNGIAGAPLAWTTTAEGGSVTGDATTDATGTGRASWTLAAAPAEQRAYVASGTLPGVVFTAAIAPPGTPGLVVLSGNFQSGIGGRPLALPVALELRGASGRPLPGAWVRRTSGHAAPMPDSALTDARGIATFSWTLPVGAGSMTSTFVAPATGATATAFATAVTGLATSVTFKTAWDSTYYYRPGTFIPNVELDIRDANGNPTDKGVTWAVEAGGGTATVAGRTLTWTLGSTPGPQRVRVTAGTSSSLVVSTQALAVFANVYGTPTVANDSLYVRSSTSNDNGVGGTPPAGVTLTLTVDGRTVPMHYVWLPGSIAPWRASLPLAGLAPGQKTGRIDFTSPQGSYSRTFTFTYQP